MQLYKKPLGILMRCEHGSVVEFSLASQLCFGIAHSLNCHDIERTTHNKQKSYGFTSELGHRAFIPKQVSIFRECSLIFTILEAIVDSLNRIRICRSFHSKIVRLRKIDNHISNNTKHYDHPHGNQNPSLCSFGEKL